MARQKKVPPPSLDEDAVGYCRPPKHSRFKDEQCGNRAGRPRGARNVATLVRSNMEEKVSVREGGRVKRITKLEVGIKRLTNKFAETGDPKVLKMLADHCPELLGAEARQALTSAMQDVARPNQAEVLAWYRDRLLQQHADGSDLAAKGNSP